MTPSQLSVQTIDYCNVMNYNAILVAKLKRFHQIQLIRINHKKTLKSK